MPDSATIVCSLWENVMSDQNKMDVSYVANLARIDLTSEENSKKGLDIIRRSLKIKDKFKNRDIHQ